MANLKKTQNIFDRVLYQDDTDRTQEPSTKYEVHNTDTLDLSQIGESQPIIDDKNDRVLVKRNGELYKYAVKDNEIKLIPKDNTSDNLVQVENIPNVFVESDPIFSAWGKPLSDMTDDATHRLVTDTEKSNWNGKMTNPMDTSGDIIYGGASGTPTKLAKGSDGQALVLSGGIPAWATLSIAALLSISIQDYIPYIVKEILTNFSLSITIT